MSLIVIIGGIAMMMTTTVWGLVLVILGIAIVISALLEQRGLG